MDRELVEKFIEVTGEGEATAAQYLALADGDLDTAVSLLFEAGGSGGGNGAALAAEQRPSNEDEPEVRAPILPTQEVLVPPDVTCSFPRAPNSIFDRFRDFAVETRRQEEELTQRASGTRRSARSKTKRLEDLFRPPCDILFLGTFNEAREHAKGMNRWLLVNIQDQQEFACQILNRDVWQNPQIRDIINDHFVLWQVLSNSVDGKRYIDFYKVNTYPYLAIIDPRTGECMRSYNHITVDSLVSGLNDMLSMHASPENVESMPVKQCTNSLQSDTISNSNIPSSNAKRSRGSENHVESGSSNIDYRDSKPSTSVISTSTNSISFVSKRSRIEEMGSKEQQMQEQQQQEQNNSDSPEDESGPFIKVCLRLPNGSKETISVSATNTVEGFIKKMENMGYQSSEYTYLIPFPKTNIGELIKTLRLSDTILYPSNTVFITKI